MPKNVLEMINDLSDDSTVGDFKAILTAQKEESDATIAKKDAELQDMNAKVLEIIENSVKGKETPESALDPAIKNTRFFKAAASGKIEEVYKWQGRMVRNDQEWSESDWKIANEAAEKAALGTVLRGDATTGSYLVPAEYESEVFRVAKQSSVMMGKVTSVDMAARSMYWPSELVTPTLTWVTDETTAKTETSPTFGQINLVAKTCAAWLTVTDELLEDSLVNLGAFFSMQFSEAWGQEFDNQVLVASTAPFIGMLRNTSCNQVTMGAGKTSFSDVEFDDLIDMENAISTAKGENALIGSSWIMSRKVFNYFRQKKDDNGNPIFQKPGEGQPGTIWDRPYIISDKMPTTSAVSTPFLILGNPKYWLHGNRVGMQFQTYNNTIRNVDYDQIFYKFRIRQGFIGGVPSAFAVLKTPAS